MSSSLERPNPKKRRADDGGEQDDDHGGGEVDDKTLVAEAKAFILKGLSKHNQAFWDDLPAVWKNDWDVAIEALVGEKTTLDKLPVDLQNDRGFMVATVNRNLAVWCSLPPTLKDDIDFARSITTYTDPHTLEVIFEKFPLLANERNTWLTIFDSAVYPGTKIYEILDAHAPQIILSDREVMTRACISEPSLLRRSVDASLSRNGDFLRDILTAKPEALRFISAQSQGMFPELVIEVLPMALRKIIHDFHCFRQTRFINLAEHIIPELWQNRGFIRAWFRGGGPFLPESVGEGLKADREVFLWMAANFPKDDPTGIVESFEFASPTLRSDKDFVLQSIAHNPNIFHAAHADLRADFDVFLMAFGGTAGKHPYISKASWKRIGRVIGECGPRIEEELKKQETFVKTFLCGVSLPHSNTSPTTALKLLNQGEATALNYKRLIAAYLDVPTGKRLRMLRQATRNLALVSITLAQIL